MAAMIPSLLKQCFKELTDITCSTELQRYESEVSHRSWLDELGRLRIWAGNIGAHQTGQSSLEYRLRDASHLRNETVKILQQILQVVGSISDLLNESEEEDERYNELFSFDESESDDPEDDMTYSQVLLKSLRETINLLFQMSMEIRRPADHDRLLGTKIKETSFFEPWAHQHASQKFPEADPKLLERLGAAMARQKAVLKYRDQHRKKLTQGLIEDSGFSEVSETIATTLPLPCEEEEEDELGFLETNSISALTQTSYAQSLLAGGDLLSVPKPPLESADGSPFECPYCCVIITIKKMKDWARHVFRDLMPYVCLAPDCDTPSKLYESRRQWLRHMLDSHSSAVPAPSTGQGDFTCPLCCTDFQPPTTFELHVGQHLEQLALFVLPRDHLEEKNTSGEIEAFMVSSSSVVDASDEGNNASELTDEHESMDMSLIDSPDTHALENSNPDGRERLKVQSLVRSHVGHWISDQTRDRDRPDPLSSHHPGFYPPTSTYPESRFPPLQSNIQGGLGKGSAASDQAGNQPPDEADHDVTYTPPDKRFRCLIPGCSDRIFTLEATFQRHIETQHYARFRYTCHICGRCERRRDKIVQHCKSSHLETPSQDIVDRNRQIIPCQPNCHFCARPIRDWSQFYRCFSSHCIVTEPELPNVSQPDPASQNKNTLAEQFDKPLTPKPVLEDEIVRRRDNVDAIAAPKPHERTQSPAKPFEDRIKELEERIAQLSQRQNQPEAASGSPRIQCRVPRCPSSDKIYQSQSSFQRHIESRHHPQARWFCPFEGCQREENSLREVHFHYQSKHLQEPVGEPVKIDLQCPPLCYWCSLPVADWPAFYTCFMSHCVLGTELAPAQEAEGVESSSSRVGIRH